MYQICFLILSCVNFAELWKIRFCILWLVFHDYVCCIIHNNETCGEPSMGLTPCCINHASVYSIDSTSLCLNGQVTKSVE